MATISSYNTAQGKRYRVRYRTPDHKSTQKRGFRTKRDAEPFAATVEVAKAGEYIAPSLGRITVGELAPELAGAQEAGHRTVALPDARIGLASARFAAVGDR